MDQTAVETLEQLGFSNYEARAYLGLQAEHPVSGYLLSKNAGVPRSRIYETLDRLVKKGYAVRHEAEPVLFSPLSPSGLKVRLQSEFDGRLSAFEQVAGAVGEQSFVDLSHIQGRQAFVALGLQMLRGARDLVCLAGDPAELEPFEGEFDRLKQQGTRIVTAVSPEESGVPHLRLVVDGGQVLSGEASPGGELAGVWSRRTGLISMAVDAIKLQVIHARMAEHGGKHAADILARVERDFSPEPGRTQPAFHPAPRPPAFPIQPLFGLKAPQVAVNPAP